MNYFFKFLLFLTIIAKCSSIKCYKCDGVYTDLNNNTCSLLVTDFDSCVTIMYHAVDTDNWIISMNGFNATVDFPGFYVKPKSGSAFFDQVWTITNEVSDHRHMLSRYFCYEDFCNPFSIISQFIESDIKYSSYKFQNDINQCLACNASDYNEAEKCKQTQVCNTCAMTSSQVLNDLYSYLNWSSQCYSFKETDEYFGDVILQYEIDTKLLNIYARIKCQDKVCATFDFMKQFLNNIILII